MIYYLSTAKHQYTLRQHFRSFGRSLRAYVRLIAYEQLFRARRLRQGVYIFTDVERLWPDQAERAARLWAAMDKLPGFKLLNHPTRSMRRYELLRTMQQQGINGFGVYRLVEGRLPEKYPVFLRGENDHLGHSSPLLHSSAELEEAVREVDRQGRSRENTLITEFCDTADAEGVYRKYAAFCIAGRVVPRHLCFEDKWFVKQPVLFDASMLDEERAYMEENPHAEQIRGIFQTARIDYGRIDYGILDGAMQVWEINTNPMLCTWSTAGGERRDWLQAEFSAQFERALQEVDATWDRCRRGAVWFNARRIGRSKPRKTLRQCARWLLPQLKWHGRKLTGWLTDPATKREEESRTSALER